MASAGSSAALRAGGVGNEDCSRQGKATRKRRRGRVRALGELAQRSMQGSMAATERGGERALTRSGAVGRRGRFEWGQEEDDAGTGARGGGEGRR